MLIRVVILRRVHNAGFLAGRTFIENDHKIEESINHNTYIISFSQLLFFMSVLY